MNDFLYSRVCRYSALALADRYQVVKGPEDSLDSFSVISADNGETICTGSFNMCTRVVEELDRSSMQGVYTAARKASKYF